MDQLDLFLHMSKLSSAGFSCAQILLGTALRDEEKENSDLLRAMGGLNTGHGYNGGSCGVLTGGCCLISYYAGKGEDEELEDPALEEMLGEFVQWFRERTEEAFGGQSCDEILSGDRANKMDRCPVLVQEGYWKAMEILKRYEVLE